ncbi:MAG: hypothetical protein WC069_07040 [Candidatus Shapirobacteria bacterium]
MKYIINLLLLLIPILAISTPQEREILIYGKDTIFMDYYPLEELRNENKELDKKLEKLFPWITTRCWRGYNGTWKIENDSLFLVKIEASSNEGEYKQVNLCTLFDETKISNNGVFAFWFSETIKANYGNFLDFDEFSWSYIYAGRFTCSVTNGLVSYIEIKLKSQTEIDKIIKTRTAKEDTAVCLVVDEMPILVIDNKEYRYFELGDFIYKHSEYLTTNNNCTGRIFVSLIVEKNGTASKKSILFSKCHELDQEILSILELMKEWMPGKNKGKVVRTKLTIPINLE